VAVSVFDLFKIGIGPSSSHTVGPMRAARLFVQRLADGGHLAHTARVMCELYGSLGATGKGHGSDKAVLLGLLGDEPDTVDVDSIVPRLAALRAARRLVLMGAHEIAFDEPRDLLFRRRQSLPFHPNGLRFIAFDAAGAELMNRCYYSVGGGFVLGEETLAREGEEPAPAGRGSSQPAIVLDTTALPFRFHSAAELLQRCAQIEGSIAEVMRRNERVLGPRTPTGFAGPGRTDAEIDVGLLRIWHVMQACVQRGLRTDGVLPGGYQVKRRAAKLYRDLTANPTAALTDPLQVLDWVNLYALAVNEENAAGGRVVTAPTNGAAGIVPAVLHYYTRFYPGATERGVIDFMLTAAAIGILYKENASISGAEVGCQGEVGVACSMAAGALCAVMGGTPEQAENAAEIGMEHHLGLTCDPVGGLVQIPCIERNAIASVKAINAARMALRGDGTHHVSLDQVIKTMRETGADMQTKYKETSRGGLAVNIVEC
jgi:L-serine dehydratase